LRQWRQAYPGRLPYLWGNSWLWVQAIAVAPRPRALAQRTISSAIKNFARGETYAIADYEQAKCASGQDCESVHVVSEITVPQRNKPLRSRGSIANQSIRASAGRTPAVSNERHICVQMEQAFSIGPLEPSCRSCHKSDRCRAPVSDITLAKGPGRFVYAGATFLSKISRLAAPVV
jgi:hypothetical protein